METKKDINKSKKTIKKKIITKPKLSLAEKQEIKLKRQKAREAAKIANGELEPKNKDRFFCKNSDLQAELIKWRDSAEKPENRVLSEEFGQMLIVIANKLLNHSNFRGYSKELKEDMRSYGFYKVIRGLKNYNFNFNNPFAWITQALYNAYLTIIGKHYKQINIRKDLMWKCIAELESFGGISSTNSIQKYIKNYIQQDENE